MHRKHHPPDSDNWCDTSSIGSSFSNNYSPKRSKNDKEKHIFDNSVEWHVVPTGGAKARSNCKDISPHPCRYDEQEQYLFQVKTTETTPSVISKLAGFINSNQGHNNHPRINNKRSDEELLVETNGKHPQTVQTNNQTRQTASAATVTNTFNTAYKLNRNDSWNSNNSDSTINTFDETTHGSRDGDFNSEESSQEGTDNTRAVCQYNVGEKERQHNSEPKGERYITTGNNDTNKDESSVGIGSNNGQTNDANGNIKAGSGGEVSKDGNSAGNENETNNNESNGVPAGDNNGREDGQGYDEATPQVNPAFDDKVMQKFVIDFKIRNTPASTIGFIHKQFIQEVLTVAPNTTFEASNRRTIPTPTKIKTIDHFPSNHLLHQKFFHRVDVRDKVSFTHDVYSSVSAMEIKRRVMPFLQEHDIGMWSEEISNNTKVRVCWVLNAHSKVSYRPAMTDKLCKGIDEQKENYGDDNNRLLNQLPKKMHHIEVQTRTVTHQGHQTVACCVMAYKPAAPVIRELVAMLDHDYLGNGTSIVSEAAARELDPGKYIEVINSNTAFHQNTRTISIKYVHDLYWDVKYRPSAQANYTTVKEWIMTGSGVVSIEQTKDTEKEGRYIILCKAEGFPVFRRVLQVMFQTLVKTIEEDEDLKRVALTKFQQYPTIIGPHKIGRYAEKNAKGLLSRIDVPTVPKPAIRHPSNKIEFDFGSAEGFPGMPVGTSAISRRATMKKTTKQQTWAAVAAPPVANGNGNASIASETSEAGKSYHSVRTGITNTDQQTLQSEAMSVLTEFISQARQEDAERRAEEREERRVEREERKAETEERRRNEDRRDETNRMMFQTMMATIMSHTGTVAVSQTDTQNDVLENEEQIRENNNKRNRKSTVQGEEHINSTSQTDQFNNMEVEESEVVDTVTQNHDTQEANGAPLIQ